MESTMFMLWLHRAAGERFGSHSSRKRARQECTHQGSFPSTAIGPSRSRCLWASRMDGRKRRVVSARDAGLAGSTDAAPGLSKFADDVKGVVCPVLGEWAAFDGRRAHAVLPYVPGPDGARRLSITLFSPRRLEVLEPQVWHVLSSLRFPCQDVRTAVCVVDPLCPHVHGTAEPAVKELDEDTDAKPPGRRKVGGLGSATVKALTAASVLRHGNAQHLDGCWVRALCDQAPTSFSCFFLDSLDRATRDPLPPCKRVSPTKAHHGLYPCGLPFWRCHIPQRCLPPKSGRRLQRWRGGMRLRAMVNASVAYLSWLALGRPGKWAQSEQHPLHVALSDKQVLMCEGLLSTFKAVCRPGELFASPGGGLAHLLAAVTEMSSSYHGGAVASANDTNVALPLVAGQVSLPSCAANVDLTSTDILPDRLVRYLEQGDRLQKPEELLRGPRPQMHCDVEDWRQLAADLWQCGLTRWVPTCQVPTIRGAVKRSGLFGVAKSSGSKLRLIVGRRPANWSEYSLREILLEDLTRSEVSFEEFEYLWRLMTLPHAASLQDAFLGRDGEFRVTAEDCSDYFHQLRLPSHLHVHTAIGFSLHREDIPHEQLAHDLSPGELAADSFTAILRVVPMGDRKAMELAQAVHQHVHLRAGTLSAASQLTHGWPLPGLSSVWGSYCDDLALVDFVHAKLKGVCSPQHVQEQSASRLAAVKQRYGEVQLQLKPQKEQLRAKEASVWGAGLSSARKEVRGDMTKMKALTFLTVELLRAVFTTTHTVQRAVGFWVHHCLFQRAALCIFQETYRWLEEGKDHPHHQRFLPGMVRQELQGCVLLFPLLRADVSSCLHPELFASDATGEIGAVIKAPLDLGDAVLAWTRRTHHLSPGVAVLQAHQLYQVSREEQKDQIWEELVAKQAYRLVSKYHFRSSAHINVKELMAVRTALRHIAEQPERWRTRALIAVDSQVAVWTLKKGRSSSRALNQVLQTMLGDVLSTGVRICPIWVATECNPADAPTRRKRIPEPEPPSELFWERRRAMLDTHPWTVSLNGYEWESRFNMHSAPFDPTRGYP
eukprot:1635292-Amphidinium_carterae.1